MKLPDVGARDIAPLTFSILLRIVRGETKLERMTDRSLPNLSVSSYGSCGVKLLSVPPSCPSLSTFSILLRIVRGETTTSVTAVTIDENLSVSSYGSCGVKPRGAIRNRPIQ